MKGHIAFQLSSSSLLSLSLAIPSIASIVFLVGVPLDEGDPLCIGIHSIKWLFMENSRAFFPPFGYLPWFPFLIESLITYFMWMHSSVSCSWHLWNIWYFFLSMRAGAFMAYGYFTPTSLNYVLAYSCKIISLDLFNGVYTKNLVRVPFSSTFLSLHGACYILVFHFQSLYSTQSLRW